MSNIITGNEKLIPFTFTEDVKEVKIDFWNEIAKLEWKDKDDGLNTRYKSPDQLWDNYTCIEICKQCQELADVMEAKFKDVDFCQKNEIEDPMELIYHIIAKGKQTYEMLLNDTEFAIAFIGQENGFCDWLGV